MEGSWMRTLGRCDVGSEGQVWRGGILQINVFRRLEGERVDGEVLMFGIMRWSSVEGIARYREVC